MSLINEIQRDFRKQTHRLHSLMDPLNENMLIRKLQREIHEEKLEVRFSISETIQSEYATLIQTLENLDIPNCTVSTQVSPLADSLIKESVHFVWLSFDEVSDERLDEYSDNVNVILVSDEETRPPRHLIKHRRRVMVTTLTGIDDLSKWLPNQHFFIQQIYQAKGRYLQQRIKVIDQFLKRKLVILKGQHILNKSQEININLDQKKKWQRQSLQLKSRLSSQIKKQIQRYEQEVENALNPEAEAFVSLFGELDKYRGFNEQDDSRNTTYTIPNEYLASVKGQMRNRFKLQIENLQEELKEVNKSINEAVESSSEKLPGIDIPKVDKPFPTENLYRTIEREEVVIKNYEKAVPKKGIYQLLMELRTPLYVIFPLFIIARFINTSDEGIINYNISTLSGEPVVVIRQLPESYNNNEQNFVAALTKQLNSGELMNQSTGEEIFKYKTDKRGLRKEAIYYLIPNEKGENQIALPIVSDRTLAIEMLETGLLKISKRFNIIKELQKIPLIFGPFKKLFGPTVLILIIWYIKTRRDSMRKEREAVRFREQSGLINELKRDLKKLINTIENSFSNQLRTYSRSLLDDFSHQLEISINNKVKSDEKSASQRLKLVKERDQYFQRSIKDIGQNSKHFVEVSRELQSAIRKA